MMVLYVLAGLFEFVGLVLALHGFKRTWAEFVEGEPLSAAFVRSSWSAVGRLAGVVNRWGRRMLRMKPRPIVGQVAASLETSWAMHATGRVKFGPLPSIAMDPYKFAAEVRNRLQRVHDIAQDVREAVVAERTARTESVSELDRRMTERIAEVAGKSESIAVGGLVEQIYGWLFIVLGVALGTIGNIVQAVE